jgi:hypothetical protein
MPVQPFVSFFRPKCDAEYITNLCGAAGLYVLAGSALSLTSPLSAAVYSLTSILSTRFALWAWDKCPCEQNDLTSKIAAFASAFFVGSIAGGFLTNALGLSMPFTTGLLLHGAVLATVLVVTGVALACILCIGACLTVRLLPEE